MAESPRRAHFADQAHYLRSLIFYRHRQQLQTTQCGIRTRLTRYHQSILFAIFPVLRGDRNRKHLATLFLSQLNHRNRSRLTVYRHSRKPMDPYGHRDTPDRFANHHRLGGRRSALRYHRRLRRQQYRQIGIGTRLAHHRHTIDRFIIILCNDDNPHRRRLSLFHLHSLARLHRNRASIVYLHHRKLVHRRRSQHRTRRRIGKFHSILAGQLLHRLGMTCNQRCQIIIRTRLTAHRQAVLGHRPVLRSHLNQQLLTIPAIQSHADCHFVAGRRNSVRRHFHHRRLVQNRRRHGGMTQKLRETL